MVRTSGVVGDTMPSVPRITPPLMAFLDSGVSCERCGHTMLIRRSWEELWFYGCSRWPDCNFTYDADQATGRAILHMRRGIPFRNAPGVRVEAALWTAILTDEFEPNAAVELEQRKQASPRQRIRSLMDMDREAVQSRIAQAAPKSQEEWLELVLQERVRAIEEHRHDAGRRLQLELDLSQRPRGLKK